MVRVIVRQTETSDVVYGGATHATDTLKSFDVIAPALEAYLSEFVGLWNQSMTIRTVIGVELLADVSKETFTILPCKEKL